MKPNYFLFIFFLPLFFFMGCESETISKGEGTTDTSDPITVSVVSTQRTYIDISWTKYISPFLSYYYVILKDEAGNEIKRVKVIPNTNPSITTEEFSVGDPKYGIDGLTQGTNYIVEINAMDASNNILFPDKIYNDPSYIKNLTTNNASDKILPTKPTLSFSNIKRKEMTINWTESTASDGAAIKYKLTVSPSVTGSPFENLTTLSKRVTGLTADREYTFTVEATAGPSNQNRINQDKNKERTVKPLLGGTLTAEARTGKEQASMVDISWNPENVQGAIRTVRAVTIGGGNLVLSDINLTANSAVITSLSVGDHCAPPGSNGGLQTYTIKVFVTDDMEDEAETEETTFTMKGPGPEINCP